MARLKRSSRILNRAERRIAGMKSISPTLDLGSGLTIRAFETSIQTVRQKLEAYNTALSIVDSAYNDVVEAEKELSSLSESMLLGVAIKYGKTSSQYEMAGGARRPERRRRIQRTSSQEAAS